jgi:hypothetical protein
MICFDGWSVVFGMLLAMLAEFVRVLWRRAHPKVEPQPCPHGHKDWDDCPDCCH